MSPPTLLANLIGAAREDADRAGMLARRGRRPSAR